MTWPRFFSFFPINVIIYLCSRRFKYICMYACMNFLFWKIILNHLKNTFAIHMSCFGVQKIQLCQLCPGVRNRITTLTVVPSPGHAQPWERRPRVPCFIVELSKVIWGNLLSWAWAVSQGIKRVIWFPHLRSVLECSWRLLLGLISLHVKYLLLWPRPFLKGWVSWSGGYLCGGWSPYQKFQPPFCLSWTTPVYPGWGALPVPSKGGFVSLSLMQASAALSFPALSLWHGHFAQTS